MEPCQSPESPTAAGRSIGEPGTEAGGKEDDGSGTIDDGAAIDILRKGWGMSMFEQKRSFSDDSAGGLSVYRNDLHLVPRAMERFKLYGNGIDLLPPEAGDCTFPVRVSFPGLSCVVSRKPMSLKELQLFRMPMRSSVLKMLSDTAMLKCLTKLSICRISIRYLPPEFGCLKKLEELDLSFNKLKNLHSDIAELNSLKLLRVANNKLVDLPSGISLLRRLENLDLSNNRLTTFVSIDLDLMEALRVLNLQGNNLVYCCQIPSWIYCNLEGNGESTTQNEISRTVVEAGNYDLTSHGIHGSRCCNGCKGAPSCLHTDALLSFRQRMRKAGRSRDYLQQRARQERLNLSRMWKENTEKIAVPMAEECSSSGSMVENESTELPFYVFEDQLLGMSIASGKSTFPITAIGNHVDECSSGGDSLSITSNTNDNEKTVMHERNHDSYSCITSDSNGLDKSYKIENEIEDDGTSACSKELEVPFGKSSSRSSKLSLKSKRHSDKDLNNPKPSKFRRPVDECSSISCKYSIESLCSFNDLLPDGFYDAGRDRPFMPLQEYERRLCLDSREVILLDREKDEELDAIAFSAQVLLSNWKSSCASGNEEKVVDNLQRASILALFVSDCFGGSDRSASIMRARRAVAGSNKQQPFVCTCPAGRLNDNGETFNQTFGIVGSPNFSDLCENSLRLIKGTRNSNVVPIGTLKFGVCRHRAVLMKYLCDRANPPIPCELVRGYLDFTPHAWNVILVRKGNAWTKMVVDACYPADIRDEEDPEYFCRYIPLSRLQVPLSAATCTVSESFEPSSALNWLSGKRPSFVAHCKFGTLDTVVKVRNLEVLGKSEEEIRHFECTFLGEVRMLGALRRHGCIVESYGHQLSSRWASPTDGSRDNRLLQSVIVMEYVRGGSLKHYLDRLSNEGEKHVPADIALCIARDVACALVEVHSKYIIHRDIKSENILIDLNSRRPDGSPVVKLSDFDRSVPLNSSMHLCCIAHFGIHPPDVCVGTPRWMAPEVVQAMHQRNTYGLEVDIWSYGCLLLELLTLQIPFAGQSEAEIYYYLQRKWRPRLPLELEVMVQSDELSSRQKAGSSSDAKDHILKLLVDMFYQCTRGNPAMRPTAKQIYEKLNAITVQPDSTRSDSNN